MLASILDVTRDGNINIEEIENVIFDGAIAASCTIKIKDSVSEDKLKKIRENSDVLSVSQAAL